MDDGTAPKTPRMRAQVAYEAGSQSTTTANDLVPPPIAGHTNMKTAVLTSNTNPANANATVTFTFTLTPPNNSSPVPGGQKPSEYVRLYCGS